MLTLIIGSLYLSCQMNKARNKYDYQVSRSVTFQDVELLKDLNRDNLGSFQLFGAPLYIDVMKILSFNKFQPIKAQFSNAQLSA